jgi:hypothetical protein
MAIAEILPPALPGSPGPHGFQKGHAKYGGRKKSSPNRFGGDLREAVVAGIQAVGFMEKGEDGKMKRGPGGVQGFIEWLAMNEAIAVTAWPDRHDPARWAARPAPPWRDPGVVYAASVTPALFPSPQPSPPRSPPQCQPSQLSRRGSSAATPAAGGVALGWVCWSWRVA